MNFGFNSNVRVGSATYHVQTEDRGPSHPFLDTVVYVAGRVVYKRNSNYEKFAKGIKPENLARILHELLAQQHRDVIAELEAGTLPPRSESKTESTVVGVATQDGLRLRLTNPKTWLAAGNVTLEIELSEKNSKKRVGNANVQACMEQEDQRIPCSGASTDAKGCATLKFRLPQKFSEESSLVVRAIEGSRYGELRFRVKTRAQNKTPAPVSR